MSKRFRIGMVVVGVVIAAIVLAVVRPGSGGKSSTAADAGPTTVRVAFRNGKVVGGLAHPKVKQGSRVVLVVSADVADEVHLHGYDIMSDVAPGKNARIAFTAKLPGRFETELESRSIPLAEIEVSP